MGACGIQEGVGQAVTTIRVINMQHCIAPSLHNGGLLQVISVTHGSSSFELGLERVATDENSGSASPSQLSQCCPCQLHGNNHISPKAGLLPHCWRTVYSELIVMDLVRPQSIVSTLTSSPCHLHETRKRGSRTLQASQMVSYSRSGPTDSKSDHLRDKIPSKGGSLVT